MCTVGLCTRCIRTTRRNRFPKPHPGKKILYEHVYPYVCTYATGNRRVTKNGARNYVLSSDGIYDYGDCEIVSVQDEYDIILTDRDEEEDEEDEYHYGVSQGYFRRFLSGPPPERKTYVAAYET